MEWTLNISQYFPKRVICIFFQDKIFPIFCQIFSQRRKFMPIFSSNWVNSHNIPKMELWKYNYYIVPKKSLFCDLKSGLTSQNFPNFGNFVPNFSPILSLNWENLQEFPNLGIWNFSCDKRCVINYDPCVWWVGKSRAEDMITTHFDWKKQKCIDRHKPRLDASYQAFSYKQFENNQGRFLK